MNHDDVEIERKYLLSAIPPLALSFHGDAIEQGYLPGTKIKERVRRRRGPHGVECTRTFKAGRGVSRTEIEDVIEESYFEGFWALTTVRLTKRRHTIPVGDRAWEIDVLDTIGVVLAEIELGHVDEVVTFPEWLAPYVVREVTHERGWTNAALAARGVPAWSAGSTGP